LIVSERQVDLAQFLARGLRAMSDGLDRVIEVINPPRWGRLIRAGGIESFCPVDDAGRPVEPVRRFLRDLVAQGCSAATIRSYAYAYALLRWWRFLLRTCQVDHA
jgi:integrase/recombinase XerD